MLGELIRDPWEVESSSGEIMGLGLLAVKTILTKEKMTFQVKAVPIHGPGAQSGWILQGYEIHMGETERGPSHPPAFRIIERMSQKVEIEDGAISTDGMVWGTYLHGLFENDPFRRLFIESLQQKKKGAVSPLRGEELNYQTFKEKHYDQLPSALRETLDIEKIYRISGIG